MDASGGHDRFRVAGNRLTVYGEIGADDERAYSEALFALLKTGKNVLEIDLRRLDHVTSAYIGATCLLVLVANQRRKTVVVLATDAIGAVLSRSGLSQIAKVEISGGAATPDTQQG